MSANRVYGDKIAINTKQVEEFYNKRAAMANEKGWEAISLGSEDPTIATRVYNYDHDVLFPKLNVDSNTRVLEIGCGMGRWASIILPHCGYYCGADFSEEMIHVANSICHDYEKRCDFYHLSAVESVEKGPEYFGGLFGSILFSGVCIYINDSEMKQIFDNLADLCAGNCTICVRETVAFTERLTLNVFMSEALNSTYNAIYRTQEQYNKFFEPLLKAGFKIVEQEFLPESVGRKRAETNGWYTILKKG